MNRNPDFFINNTLQKSHILDYNSINANSIQIFYKPDALFKLTVRKYSIYRNKNLYPEFVSVINNLLNILQRVRRIFPCSKCSGTDINCVCAAINCSKRGFFIFCG